MHPQQEPTRRAIVRQCLAGPAIAAAVLVGLGACTGTGGGGGGTIYFTDFTAGYMPSSIAAAHPLLVQTFGSPTPGVEPAAVTGASVQGLRQSGPAWMPREYTGNPADVPKPAYVLRFAFGVPKAFNGQQICKTDMSGEALEAARGSEDAGATRTISGLCRGERAIVYGEGSPGASPNVNGEGFRKFMGLFGRQMMPRKNPVLKGDCSLMFC